MPLMLLKKTESQGEYSPTEWDFDEINVIENFEINRDFKDQFLFLEK